MENGKWKMENYVFYFAFSIFHFPFYSVIKSESEKKNE